jgi:alpha-2-macroglobulin
MKWLAGVYVGIIWLIRWLFSAIPAIFSAIFGRANYAAPNWFSSLARSASERPVRALLVTTTLGLFAWGVHFWANYVPPEPPNLVHASLSAPAATDYRAETLYYAPFSVDFDASVAPIDAATDPSKIGAVPVKGVKLSPNLSGSWAWNNDRSLVFTPTSDWPIGTQFTVEVDPKLAYAPHVIVDKSEFDFTTAEFAVSLSSEYNQDPSNALLKQAVYTLNFSHPVDAKSLESKLSLAAEADTTKFPEAKLSANDPLRSAKFSVRYDEKNLTAYVTTDALKLPDAGSTLTLWVAEGVQSSLQNPLDGKRNAVAGSSSLLLPSLYSLSVANLELASAENNDGEPEQILLVATNESMADAAISAAISAYVLPRDNSGKPTQLEPYSWQVGEVTETVLRQSQRLKLAHLPGERDVLATHTFRYDAPIGRTIYAQIAKNTTAFGGTKLGELYQSTLTVPEFPKALSFVGDGALLSLKGEKRVSVLSRNVIAYKLEVSRVLPDQLQHWVKYSSGSFKEPNFNYIEQDSLVERFERVVRLPALKPGATHYEGIDLSPYFTAEKHGVFYIQLTELVAPAGSDNTPLAQLKDEQLSETESQAQRLIVLSDLGVVAKKSLDESREVFVQEIRSGTPAADVVVDVIGVNGLSVQSVRTDALGHARLDNFSDYRREHAPVLMRFTRGEDMSFLPIKDEHDQDYSRFDISGLDTPDAPGALNVHAFSDRGLYRPGDSINFGIIARAFDWKKTLVGVPLQAVITDPSDTEVYSNAISLNDTGFVALQYTTSDSDASGSYTLRVYEPNDTEHNNLLGQVSVEVKEFLPDQMKMRSRFSAEAGVGWVKPEGLSAIVQVDTLFGTPAQGRRVTSSLSFSPTVPSFEQFPGFSFFDPTRNHESFGDTLEEKTSNETGEAQFALGLEKYSAGTFFLTVSSEAFEAGSGRSVTSYVQTLVSTADSLIGIKSADSLSYVSKDAPRSIEVVAVDAKGLAVAQTGLRVVIEESKYISVLTKQDSGVYKYISQERTDRISDTPLNLSAAINTLKLNTSKPGRFALKLLTADDVQVNAIDYSVAGTANLSRSLDRNAELELALSKREYQAGQDLEVNIRAPYAGTGLLTIERDQVYAHAWFKADTESSVQRIRIPENLEGGAYLSVQFVRSPDSPEVFMSPLSYGAVPFTLDRRPRTQPIDVSLPKRVKPGEELKFDVTTEGAADVVVFAVDEGILQVAKYQLDNPLDTFFPKRRLQVDTSQILDLILPEFSRLLQSSAPGGGGEELLGSNLNPFKRKADKPAVYWSGIQRVDGKAQFSYTPPEYFNGTLKVFAVAVSSTRIGTYRGAAQVRGDFVLQVNIPTTLSPGDQFNASVNVSYPKTPEMKSAAEGVEKAIEVRMVVAAGLSVAQPTQTIKLAPGGEGVLRFAVSAASGQGQKLGSAALTVSASAGALNAKRTIALSVRPANPFVNSLRVGRIDAASAQLKDLRVLWPEFSRRELVAGTTPLVLARGLAGYLDDFPYACSEQLSSQAFARLVLISHPELTPLSASGAVPIEFDRIVSLLASRQNSEGGFGLWQQTPNADAFVSAYIGLLIQEAKGRNIERAAGLWPNTERYLKALSNDASLNDLAGLRTRAFAAYVRTRAGITTTAEIAGIQEMLDKNVPESQRKDVTSLLLAASLKLLKVNAASDSRAQAAVVALNAQAKVDYRYENYFDPAVADALNVYLLHRHFQNQAKLISPQTYERLLAPIVEGTNNTLSSALTMLALEAAAQNAPTNTIAFKQTISTGAATAFGAAQGWLYSGAFTDAAKSLTITKPGSGPVWYALTEAGFDQAIDVAAVNSDIEVSKIYLDASGSPLTRAVKIGEELSVVVKLRSTDQQSHSDIALVDLLPGGFDAISDSGVDSAISTRSGATPTHSEIREDRVVIYTTATEAVSEYYYRIKATNAGSFARPRSVANSMYERKVRAREAQLPPAAAAIAVLE